MSGARRYGGAHSPGAARPSSGAGWSARAIRAPSIRAILLHAAPTPLLLGVLWSLATADAPRMLALGATWIALTLGAHLTRTGLAAARAYDEHATARPPAFPRKLSGAALTGLGVGAAVTLGGAAPMSAGLFGAVAAGLHVLSFGVDPMRAKGVNGLEGAALDAAITRIETARALIGDMTRAAAGFGDRALEARVARLAAAAEEVVARIERDPRELRRARRFLSVYLVGARDATVKAAQAWAETRDWATIAGYARLLDDLESHFAAQRDALTIEDRTALDVEIEVLRDRLKLEGV
jgi:hypothetical protein